MHAPLRAVLLAALMTATSGCASTPESAELALIYNASARHHGPDRNPIIAIPGILGSKLMVPPDLMAWGAFEPGAADPGDPQGARVIALPIRAGEPLSELRDGVVPAGVLDRVRIQLIGIALEIQAYAGILATLGAGGYRDDALGLAGEVDYGDDHFTCFQFAYDWRRDNVENARRLHEFILEKREYVRGEYAERFGIDDADVKFDIAAHSMGGLLTRYFLMYGSQDLPEDGSLPELTWEGANLVERVITIGTPNAGSASALVELVEGRKIGPLLPFYPPALMGTFPTLYQLLPRARHQPVVWDADDERPLDHMDPALWQRMGWGLASPDEAPVLDVLMPDVRDPEQRRKIALAVQATMLERASAFHRAIDRPARAPDGLDLFLVAGDAAPTTSRISVSSEDGSVLVMAHDPGDGVVLRSSALMDERLGAEWAPQLVTPIDFDSYLFLPEDHLGLTSGDVFRDNVLFWLLEEPR